MGSGGVIVQSAIVGWEVASTVEYKDGNSVPGELFLGLLALAVDLGSIPGLGLSEEDTDSV